MEKRTKLIAAGLAAAVVAIAATVVGYQDWQVRGSTPANPATGYYRTWADSPSGLIKCITSTGAACFFNPPSGGAVVFQTNGTNNGSQTLLDLQQGSNITLTDNGSGQITIAGTGGGSSLLLQTNTVNNGSQTLLNLVQGGGITLVDNGSGNVTISTTAGSTRGIGMAFGTTGGTPLTTGQKQYVTVPFGCTLQGWNITTDTGTAAVDVWKLAAGPSDWSNTSGTVNTLGTAVTWLTGTTFPTDAAGRSIKINSVLYGIASVNSSTSLTLMTSAGTQSGVTYNAPGTAVPTISNTIDGTSLPTVSSGTFAGSTNLSGWTTGVLGTTVLKNDVFGFNINSVSGSPTAISVVLECQQ